MILIENHICYSPYPPAAYAWRGTGIGVAFLLRSRLPAWNLVWLSLPAVDAYLAGVEPSLAQLASLRHSAVLAATVKIAASEKVAELPYLLTLEPDDFLAGFEALPWQQTTAGYVMGRTWIETIRQRVAQAMDQPLIKRPVVLTTDQRNTLSVPLPRFKERA